VTGTPGDVIVRWNVTLPQPAIDGRAGRGGAGNALAQPSAALKDDSRPAATLRRGPQRQRARALDGDYLGSGEGGAAFRDLPGGTGARAREGVA